jgi:hypothetical protein
MAAGLCTLAENMKHSLAKFIYGRTREVIFRYKFLWSCMLLI